MSFLGVSLLMFNPWFTLILIFSTLPSFLGEYYFNSKNYLLNRSQMHRKRELEYLSFVGASDQTAKEVRVFDLSSFFIGRFRTIANKLYADTRSLNKRRTGWGIFLAIVGVFGYYTALVCSSLKEWLMDI